jgi:hypothetical protein
MLMNHNSQLVDSRWKKGNSPSSEQWYPSLYIIDGLLYNIFMYAYYK